MRLPDNHALAGHGWRCAPPPAGQHSRRCTGECPGEPCADNDGAQIFAGDATDGPAISVAVMWPSLMMSAPPSPAIVLAPAACDDIGEAAASDREGFGSTRLRDRDASPGHRGGDRLHSLDRVRGAQSVEFGRSRRQVARARNNM